MCNHSFIAHRKALAPQNLHVLEVQHWDLELFPLGVLSFNSNPDWETVKAVTTGWL